MLNFFNRIKNKINQKTALISLRNDWFHDFDHFRNYTKPVLSKAEIKEASAYYNQYGLKIRPDWHNYYKYMTGTFDARFIPADIMYTVIVPYLNYMPFELAYQCPCVCCVPLWRTDGNNAKQVYPIGCKSTIIDLRQC